MGFSTDGMRSVNDHVRETPEVLAEPVGGGSGHTEMQTRLGNEADDGKIRNSDCDWNPACRYNLDSLDNFEFLKT